MQNSLVGCLLPPKIQNRNSTNDRFALINTCRLHACMPLPSRQLTPKQLTTIHSLQFIDHTICSYKQFIEINSSYNLFTDHTIVHTDHTICPTKLHKFIQTVHKPYNLFNSSQIFDQTNHVEVSNTTSNTNTVQTCSLVLD